MKKVFIIYAVLLVGIGIVYFGFIRKNGGSDSGSKQAAITVSQHSQAFNASMQKMMDNYYAMTEDFVNWDTIAINKHSAELKTAVDEIKLDDLQKDTLIYKTALGSVDNIKNELIGMTGAPNIYEKRASLSLLSNQLYDLLRIVRYDAAKVYLQECPMALSNYETAGNWLSKTDEVRNPFLGNNDPKYGNKMINCGEPKDTLNFVITAK